MECTSQSNMHKLLSDVRGQHFESTQSNSIHQMSMTNEWLNMQCARKKRTSPENNSEKSGERKQYWKDCTNFKSPKHSNRRGQAECNSQKKRRRGNEQKKRGKDLILNDQRSLETGRNISPLTFRTASRPDTCMIQNDFILMFR